MKSGTLMLWAAFILAAGVLTAEEIRPGVYRTPDDRFENLPGYNFEPHYKEINGYRVHYLDEGPRDGQTIMLIHGEPTWAYLYRKMIPVLTEAGHRCIVPDLIGFGRSDKPASMDTHTYEFHVDVMTKLVVALDLRDATFFGQDWGGLIGLRVVAENEERFARVVISNTGLATGQANPGGAFMRWKAMNQAMIDRGDMAVGQMVARNVGDASIAAAYDAPFPEPKYKAGPLIMPQRVPVLLDDPAREANLKAWEVFERWEKPFLTAFGDSDPITRGGHRVFQQRVPGAKGQAHTIVEGAGHFIQEMKGEELARIINKFIADNPIAKKTAMVTADDIPIAHTPRGYWKTMPPPILADCTEPLAPGIPDLRGLWKAYEGMVGHVERIEQCGNRVIVVSSGVIHDMRADGTLENGVNDIAGRGETKINVAAEFVNGSLDLRPNGGAVMVRRYLDGDDLVWVYGDRTSRLRRIPDPAE